MGNTTARDNKEEDQNPMVITPKKSKAYWKYRCTLWILLLIIKSWALYYVSHRSYNVPSFTISQSSIERSKAYQNLYGNAYLYTAEGSAARTRKMLLDYQNNQKLHDGDDNSGRDSLGSTTENLVIKKLASLYNLDAKN